MSCPKPSGLQNNPNRYMLGARFRWLLVIAMSYDTLFAWFDTPGTPVFSCTGLMLLTNRKILFLGWTL